MRNLGIFYSNNNNRNTFPAIEESLRSIEKSAKGKADIVTCVWNPIPGNPFKQLIAWTQTTSHLNQILQILQCLYYAREQNEYKYVSFLEHDVLYPTGYFDFPEFSRGEIMVNMNYGGMISKGFQVRKQHDQPFHQMTMRFDEAIKHCENILANALITNSGLIEPNHHKRIVWNCQNESIHINHGSHFTSHFSIYDSSNLSQDHQHWGHISRYQHLF